MPPRSSLRSGLRAWAPLPVALVLGLIMVQGLRAKMFNPAEAAMGELTISMFGSIDGQRVHCSDNRDTQACIDAYAKAGKPPALLWLGNSQLHGVNRYQEGQKTAGMLAHEALAKQGRYLVTYSEPNANLMEHRLLFDRLRQSYDIRTLILPVCLDDFREVGIRDTLAATATTTNAVEADKAPDPVATPAAKGAFSLQPIVEDHLETTLAAHSPLWHDRQGLKGTVNYAVYFLRNRAFGINAQTKRPVSDANYAEKLTILKGILAEAKAAHIKVVLYAPPYRTDIPGPYVTEQYDRLVRDLAALASPGEIQFLDLTHKVPGPEWGMLSDSLFGTSDYDFMHFTAEGHRRLAESVIPAL